MRKVPVYQEGQPVGMVLVVASDAGLPFMWPGAPIVADLYGAQATPLLPPRDESASADDRPPVQ